MVYGWSLLKPLTSNNQGCFVFFNGLTQVLECVSCKRMDVFSITAAATGLSHLLPRLI